WVAGRWEAERPGKKFRDDRWERKGDEWVFIKGDWEDGPAAPVSQYPTSAPPPPRNETFTNRPGQRWIPGFWDWKNGKYEWVAGRYEADRPGAQWRPRKWEQKNGRWEFVEGGWDGGAAPAGNYPTTAPPVSREERPAPRSGFVWAPGHYKWEDGRYQWVNGH